MRSAYLELVSMTRIYPTKSAIRSALGLALTAALACKEPWGNAWATGVLAAFTWLAAEAEEGSVELGRALFEGRDHAQVALHGTVGMRHVETLNTLATRWFMAQPIEPCACGGSLCAACMRAAKGL